MFLRLYFLGKSKAPNEFKMTKRREVKSKKGKVEATEEEIKREYGNARNIQWQED